MPTYHKYKQVICSQHKECNYNCDHKVPHYENVECNTECVHIRFGLCGFIYPNRDPNPSVLKLPQCNFPKKYIKYTSIGTPDKPVMPEHHETYYVDYNDKRIEMRPLKYIKDPRWAN